MEVQIDRRKFMAASLATLAGAGLGGLVRAPEVRAADKISLPKLPYARDGLEPYISGKTLSFHYGKHHAGYVAKANKALSGHGLEGAPLEKIIQETANKPELAGIFNNAAQVFNHSFFWRSMKPGGGGPPQGAAAQAIDRDFGSYDKFREVFSITASSVFGSGWVWLAQEKGKLKVLKTANADNPLTGGLKPVLTLDLWEHAYYLDYQNRRGDFIQAYLDHLIDWDFAAANL